MAETTPVEEMPLGMLIAWLSVFLAVVLFGPDSTCKCNGWFRVGLF